MSNNYGGMVIPEEISMIVSSSPNAGAINKSSDGSYFEIQLQDGLQIPHEALNVNVSVEEASIWWVVPNIITGENDKMYITGGGAIVAVDNITLGYDANNTFDLTTGTLNINKAAGADLIVGAFVIGDTFRIDTGTLAGQSFEITTIVTDTVNLQTYTVTPNTVSQAVGTNSFSRLRAGATQQYIVTIPQGLYDLSGINQAILRELENQGARIDPDPLITLTPDEPTQKVEIRFNYADVSIDFTQIDTPRVILGFNSAVYGPYVGAPINVLAPNIAEFNQVNYFLIHSDLTNKGIRFNNDYNQTLAQVLIDVAPGSQIVNKPFNPAKVNAPELTGSKRNLLRFWITDDQNRRVNTNGEDWTARIVIHYLKPYVIGRGR